jgi:hypothetical protein
VSLSVAQKNQSQIKIYIENHGALSLTRSRLVLLVTLLRMGACRKVRACGDLDPVGISTPDEARRLGPGVPFGRRRCEAGTVSWVMLKSYK